MDTDSPIDDHDIALTQLIDEFLERRRAGEKLRIEEFVRQHPDYADELRTELNDELSWLEKTSSVRQALQVKLTEQEAELGWEKVKRQVTDTSTGTEQEVDALAAYVRPTTLQSFVRRIAESFKVPRWRLAAAGVCVALVALVVTPWLLRDFAYLPAPEVRVDVVCQPSDTGSVRRVPLRSQSSVGLKLRSTQQPDAPVGIPALSNFSIEIRPETETYLYLFQWDSTGRMRVLFPNTEHSSAVNPLTPGRSYRLPERHNWFPLDSVLGVQTIAYVASSRPWGAIEKNIEKLMILGDQLRHYGPAGEALSPPFTVKEFIDIGGVHDNLGEYSLALEYYQQALEMQREIGDKAGEGRTLNNIGGVHGNLSEYSLALEYCQHALEIQREIGDKAGEGRTLNNIGGVHDNLGDYSLALSYYQQALEIQREIGDKAGDGTSLNATADDIRELLSEAEYDKDSRYRVQSSSFRYVPRGTE